MIKKLNLIGASGHAKVIKDIAELAGYEVLGVYDDNPKLKELSRLKVKGNVASLPNFDSEQFYFISIGNNRARQKISTKFQTLHYPKITHPSSVVAESSSIKEGTALMAGSIVNPCCNIGQHCIINTGATIDHDCILEDFVHISPNATLSGNVSVGEGTHIGAGAVVIQGIRIGKWATIGAGTVVIRDIPDGYKMVGNPAKPI